MPLPLTVNALSCVESGWPYRPVAVADAASAQRGGGLVPAQTTVCIGVGYAFLLVAVNPQPFRPVAPVPAFRRVADALEIEP